MLYLRYHILIVKIIVNYSKKANIEEEELMVLFQKVLGLQVVKLRIH